MTMLKCSSNCCSSSRLVAWILPPRVARNLYADDPFEFNVLSMTISGLYISGLKAACPELMRVRIMVALLQCKLHSGHIAKAYSAPLRINSFIPFALPVCAALPPKAIAIAVKIADFPPKISL